MLMIIEYLALESHNTENKYTVEKQELPKMGCSQRKIRRDDRNRK